MKRIIIMLLVCSTYILATGGGKNSSPKPKFETVEKHGSIKFLTIPNSIGLQTLEIRTKISLTKDTRTGKYTKGYATTWLNHNKYGMTYVAKGGTVLGDMSINQPGATSKSKKNTSSLTLNLDVSLANSRGKLIASIHKTGNLFFGDTSTYTKILTTR